MVPKAFAQRVVNIREQTLPVSSAPGRASPNFFKGQPEPSLCQNSVHGIYKYPQPPTQHATPGQTSIMSSALPATISMPSTSRYIMFSVDSGGLKLSAIESKSLCNEQLFRQMRSEFRRIKGWFKTWFGLMTFSHCDFYQVCPMLFVQRLSPKLTCNISLSNGTQKGIASVTAVSPRFSTKTISTSLGHSTSLHYPSTSFTIVSMKGFALSLV